MTWILYALLSAFFAGLVAIFGKLGLKEVDSTLATAVRSVVMAGFLVVVALSLGKAHLMQTLTAKPLTFIILSGVAGALSWLFYFFALKHGTVASVASVDKLSIVFAVVFAFIFIGEKITLQAGVGLLLIVGGTLLMIK